MAAFIRKSSRFSARLSRARTQWIAAGFMQRSSSRSTSARSGTGRQGAEVPPRYDSTKAPPSLRRPSSAVPGVSKPRRPGPRREARGTRRVPWGAVPCGQRLKIRSRERSRHIACAHSDPARVDSPDCPGTGPGETGEPPSRHAVGKPRGYQDPLSTERVEQGQGEGALPGSVRSSVQERLGTG